MHIEVKVINPLAKTYGHPAYQTKDSAGLDLVAVIENPITIQPGECYLIGTGLAFYLRDPGYCGLVLPRSGLGHKHGIILGNGVGLIDPDYQGELKISCYNRSGVSFTVEPGMRLAQLLVIPFIQVQAQLVAEFSSETTRGAAGFGSTGFTQQKEIEPA